MNRLPLFHSLMMWNYLLTIIRKTELLESTTRCVFVPCFIGLMYNEELKQSFCGQMPFLSPTSRKLKELDREDARKRPGGIVLRMTWKV